MALYSLYCLLGKSTSFGTDPLAMLRRSNVQVQYPLHIGRAMHALALPAALLAMFVLARVLKVDYDPVLAALQGALLWIAAAVSAAAVPAILGTVRVALTGTCSVYTQG